MPVLRRESLARDVAHQILTTGRVSRAFLGIGYRDFDPELTRQFRLPVQRGIVVQSVGAGTPAARAGIRARDLIVRVGGTEITHGGDLRRVLRSRRPSDTVTVRGVRPTGQFEVRVTLADAPQT